MFAVCGAMWHANASLKPFLNRKRARATQKWLQTCCSKPQRAADSKHHSSMLDTTRGTAHGVEHAGT
eukprot:1751743-Lingulodinium_polyedra.AAC.1